MNVLVAGAGWLGREIATRLAARGDHVVAVRRDAGALADLRPCGVETVGADLLDPASIGLLPTELDAVVGCQAAVERSAVGYRNAYVTFNESLAELARRTAATRFVYTGSTGVFGQDDGATVDENTPPYVRSVTAKLLLAGENIVRRTGTVVRLSGLYGPGRFGVIERVRTGVLVLGPGDRAWMNFCHLEDAVRAVVAAIDRGKVGAVYHGTDATPTRRADVVRWIAERLGVEPTRTDADVTTGERRADRRVDGAWTRSELGVELAYPSFRDGLAAAFDRTD